MEYIQVFLTSVFSAAILFFTAKILGYRQMSELSMFDYINGITIGSIAAELATSEGTDFVHPLIAIVVFTLFTLLLTILTDKSVKLRRFITGEPIILFSDGVLYDENFKKAKLDLNEFLMQCREAGYFGLAQVDTVMIEPNGSLSILPVSKYRPATPNDMQLNVTQEKIPAEVILDGEIMEQNLASMARDKAWLKVELNKRGIRLPDVFLATLMPDGTLSVYLRGGKKKNNFME